jgi:hypothetical protein
MRLSQIAPFGLVPMVRWFGNQKSVSFLTPRFSWEQSRDKFLLSEPEDAVSLFVGRPFQAVVAAKKGQFRRPEKGVLHFLTAWKRRRGIEMQCKIPRWRFGLAFESRETFGGYSGSAQRDSDSGCQTLHYSGKLSGVNKRDW